MTPLTASAAPATPWRSFALRGLKVLLIGTGIALVFTLASLQRLGASLAYALPITFGCWFFIDAGRLLAARWVSRRDTAANPQWPGWPWMSLVLLVGTVLGYQSGHSVGNLLTGRNAPGLLFEGPARALSLVLISLVPGVAATWFFYTRGRLAATEARAPEAQRHATQAKLRLLESQMEPHMLFNTLANLRVLIALDPPRAQAMLDQLIAFLRATLTASRTGQHTLSAEFSRIADYLALMKVRMGDRLQTRLALPDELADLSVPALLLQPLVENCIPHGLEPSVSGGRIELTAARDCGELVLSVRDTGVGLAQPSIDGTRFGLQQVRERLAVLYGERASLSLAAAGDAEGGTIAVIRLPVAP
jgi:signal transduction histidine kinase